MEVASGLLVSRSAQMDSTHYFSRAHSYQTNKRRIQQPASQLLGVLLQVIRMQMRQRHQIVVDLVATNHRIRHLFEGEIVREDEIVLCFRRRRNAHGGVVVPQTSVTGVLPIDLHVSIDRSRVQSVLLTHLRNASRNFELRRTRTKPVRSKREFRPRGCD